MPRRAARPALAAALLLAACRGREAEGPLQVRENAFSWSGHVPAGALATVRNFAGGIEVTPSADDTMRVTARVEWRRGDPDESLRLSGSTTGADVLICAIWGTGTCTTTDYNANFKIGRNGTDAKVFLQVAVPAGVRLVLTNISGDVAAAASAPVRAQTMNGDVRVATAVGPVQAETLNGSVDIRMSSLAGTDSVLAKTLNGRALIFLPAVTDATIDLGVGNGSVASDFPEGAPGAGQAKKLRVAIGTGARIIHGYALNGEVALRRLDAEGRSY